MSHSSRNCVLCSKEAPLSKQGVCQPCHTEAGEELSWLLSYTKAKRQMEHIFNADPFQRALFEGGSWADVNEAYEAHLRPVQEPVPVQSQSQTQTQRAWLKRQRA